MKTKPSEILQNLRRAVTNVLDGIYEHRRIYLVLWLLSILSIFDIAPTPNFKIALPLQIIYTVCVGAFKATVLMVPLLWLLRKCSVIAYFVIGIYALLATINFGSYFFYGFGISRKLLWICLQTTATEFSEFIPGLWSNILSLICSPSFILVILLTLSTIYLAKYCNRKIATRSIVFLSLVGVLAHITFSIFYTGGRTAPLLTVRTARFYSEVIEWNRNFEELKTQKRELPFAETVRSRHRAGTVVVVIGESASRSHHSYYGYPLPTTPCVGRMSDSIFFFTDVIGSSTSTAGNMERILSFKTDDTTAGDGLKYPLLVSLFEKAGYKTFWLSNQERSGSVSNTSGVMILDARVIKYIGADNSEDQLVRKFDHDLLPELTSALEDTAQNKLIFLHLMGSHTEFDHRYPMGWDAFSCADEIRPEMPWLTNRSAKRRAAYDNSIRYTDALLGQVIRLTADNDVGAVMIYFSDHGENVYDEDNTCGRGEKYVEVPFFIFANDKYLSAFPETEQRLSEAVDRKFSTANFVHLLMNLTGTDYKCYDATRDVLSPSYRQRVRMVDENPWAYE